MKRFLAFFVVLIALISRFNAANAQIHIPEPVPPPLKVIFEGHRAVVWSVAFSPDGQVLASASWDKTIRLWDLRTRQLKTTLIGHTEDIMSVVFSPDGQTLASASWDGTIRLWNPHNGKHKRTLTEHSGGVSSVAFSPDGQTLASGSADQTIRLWDTDTWQLERTLTGHTHVVDAVVFSSDGDMLASGSRDTTIRLWNPNDGKHHRTLPGHTSDIVRMAFNPDDTTLVSGSLDKTIRLWNPRNGKHKRTLVNQTGWTNPVAFSSDGEKLVIGGRGISVWNIQTGQYEAPLVEDIEDAVSVAFSPDGQMIASGSTDNKVRLWEFIPTDAAPVVHVESSNRPPMYWIDAEAGTLHRLINNEVEHLLPNVQNATSLAVDMNGGKLYWTEKTSNRTGRIRRANLDGTHVQLVKTLTSVPHGIALDSVNGKIYLTNSWGKIQRLNIDGSNFQSNFIQNLNAPKYIVLNAMSGKIYWTESGRRIRRANLDGSNIQNIATGLTAPLSLVVGAGKVYWTSARKLQRSDLDGINRQVLKTLPTAPSSLAVDPARNLLYLTLPTGVIQQRDLTGSGELPIATGLGSPTHIVLNISARDPSISVVHKSTDVNQDQKVNKTDLLLVVTALGENPPANPNFDVNADGTVNIADLLLVIEELDDPVAAAAPTNEWRMETSLDPSMLEGQLNILRAENDGSARYEQAIAFLRGLLASVRPTETQLLANYPNPFNPETWIPYQLSEASDVKLTIYDTRGVVVRQLDLGHQRAGIYTSRSRAAYWNGKNETGEPVASGVYFYTLTVGEFTATRRMLIRK